MSENEPVDVALRHLARERTARKVAETLLEQKSQEIYVTNQNLRALNAHLEESETRYRKLVELMPDAIIVHTDGQIVFLNDAAMKLFGARSVEHLLGTSVFDRVPEEYRALLDGKGRQASENGPDGSLVALQMQRLDGSLVDVEVIGTVIQFQKKASVMVVAHDTTERRQYEAAIEHQATHDLLTGLPNRVLFFDRLTHAIRRAERHSGKLTVMFVDLDKFKYINDTLGHKVGDQLLRIIAERLKECVRDSDTVARLGGDEFVLLTDNSSGANVPSLVAQRVIQRLATPASLAGQEHMVTCSIGISMYPEDGDHAEALLQQADIAMYRAKEAGRNAFQFFTQDMQNRLDERIHLEQCLHRALQRNEFVLHFQPQVDLRNGRIIGLEALIRWQSPELGLVSPGRFIPVAEESNLILAIGEWVIHTVCGRIKAWQESGLPIVPVAVNLAASQFAHQGIDRLTQHVLELHGLEAKYLELELTESLSMDDPETSIALMHRLKEIGVSLAIDDFGTGYSNLSYLKRFPVNKLKIDQSFVQGLTHDSEDRSITTAVINLAHSLGLRVIAEGVETEGQLRLLAAEGCDEIQGYYFSHPLPEADIIAMLQRQHCLDITQLERRPSCKTLLVMDDELQVLASFKRLLHGQPVQLLTAERPGDAYELLACQEVGVVISDQNLPDEDGISFFARIKQLYPRTVRILLTGQDSSAILTDAINKGEIYKFIAKPWDSPQVLEIVKNAFLHYER